MHSSFKKWLDLAIARAPFEVQAILQVGITNFPPREISVPSSHPFPRDISVITLEL